MHRCCVGVSKTVSDGVTTSIAIFVSFVPFADTLRYILGCVGFLRLMLNAKPPRGRS